jgi:autotransporter-associated beta strand protein
VNINNGGHLAPSSGNTLSASALTLGAGSNVDVALGTPSTTSLMNVGGNLTLDGNLNVTDAGGFGVGVYRLFNYTGSLTNNGLTWPACRSVRRSATWWCRPVANQINMVVSAPNSNLRSGTAARPIANGLVDGGSGTWNAAAPTGPIPTAAEPDLGRDFAVFRARPVRCRSTARNCSPACSSSPMATTWSTARRALTAVNGTGGTTAVRVDPGVTATVGVNIDGSGILNKLDAGTLVLNGANSYTGGTQLDGGKLVVGSNTALGSGALTANAGTQLDSNTAVTLANAATLNGNLTLAGSNALTLNGVIGGTGGLIKNGAANLTLGGNNAFLGR